MQTTFWTALLTSLVALPLPVWLVMHEDLRTIRRCKLAFDALQRGLSQYLA